MTRIPRTRPEGVRVEDLRREGHPQRLAGRPRRSRQDHPPRGHALHVRRHHAHGHRRGRQHGLRPRSGRAAQGHLASRCRWRPIEWDGVKINVLDAPGYADFIGDLRSAIRAVDAVIVVVSAVDGVEVQTEAAWELAVEAGLPRAIFVNKLDRERSSFQGTLDQLVSSFGNQVAPLELPIGAEARVLRRSPTCCTRRRTGTRSGPIAEEGDWPDELARRSPTPPARSSWRPWPRPTTS